MPTIAAGTTIPRQDLNAALVELPPKHTYVAGMIMPTLEVPTISGNMGVIPRGAYLSRQNVNRKSDGTYNRSKWKFEDIAYATKEYGHEESLDNRKANAYRSYADFERARAIRVREIMLREREFRVKELLLNLTTFPLSGNTGLSVTTKWDNAAATPIDDVKTGQRLRRVSSGLVLDVLRISWQTWTDLSNCPQILDRLKYTSAPEGRIDTGILASAMGLRKIIVSNAMYNTADEGQTEVLDDIWGAQYANLMALADTEDPEEPCVGRTFCWKGDGGGDPDDPTIEEYVQDDARGSVLRGRNEVQEKILIPEANFVFGNLK